MLKRYFQTFDKEGRMLFIVGCVTFLLTVLLTYVVQLYFKVWLAGFILGFGVSYSFKFINVANLGSIYRQKDGKNKDLYLSKKEYLDKRFKDLF